MKPFSSLEEQIDILTNRKLKIDDSQDAKNYLLNNNYYNVVNLYSKILLENSNSNSYIDGSTFAEIKYLHILDTEIKSTILKYLIQAEKHFKSIFSYCFCDVHRDKYDYLKTESYDPDRTLDIHRTLSTISNKINSLKNSRNENAIKHYFTQHNSVPLWVIINELTFGDVKYMYKYSKADIRLSVADYLSEYIASNNSGNIKNKLAPNTVDIILHCVNELRNCCAHNNKLWDFKTRDSIPYIPEIYDGITDRNDTRSNFFAIFLSLQSLIHPDEFRVLSNTLRKRFRTTSKKIHSVDFNTVLAKYGFPKNWHDNDPLPQIS